MDTSTIGTPMASTPRIYKRRLAINHAMGCQNAKHNICKCRCKGLLHGIDHLAYKTIEDQLFADKKAMKQPVYESDIDLAVQKAVSIIKSISNVTSI